MSIEERVYEVKKKWLPIYTLLFIALIILGIFFILLYSGTRKDEYLNISMFTLLFSGILGFNAFKLFKINPPKYKIIKVLECESCGYRRTEEGARKGEYIYREVGTCPQCGKELLITAIYREKIGKGS